MYSKIDEVLDIYMDGVFQFSLNYKNSMEIDNVSFDTHELEAKKRGTEILLDSATIEVEEEIDYGWWIEDPADINVTNSFGETLKIYMDEIYQFDLVDEENRWIIDVSWGEHFLKALRISDGGQVASKTIDITDDLDYTWTIDKPK
ncbi:MAG: hypothetical protein JXB23_03510 [Candidatus Aminicenantes bacterium]|nr:hypothetical protein [Candidatus Aminicenantes bacterium]